VALLRSSSSQGSSETPASGDLMGETWKPTKLAQAVDLYSEGAWNLG
jgi:hypothetical protein